MSSIVYKILKDMFDRRENPHQTKVGQEVVSIQESFNARLLREGRNRNKFIQGKAAPSGSVTTECFIEPSPGTSFYPTNINVSCDVDAQLMIKVVTRIADDPDLWHVSFAKAGQPLTYNLNGNIKVYERGSILIAVLPNSAGKIYGSITGVEVVENA